MALKSLEIIFSDRDLLLKIATVCKDILVKFTKMT